MTYRVFDSACEVLTVTTQPSWLSHKRVYVYFCVPKSWLTLRLRLSTHTNTSYASYEWYCHPADGRFACSTLYCADYSRFSGLNTSCVVQLSNEHQARLYGIYTVALPIYINVTAVKRRYNFPKRYVQSFKEFVFATNLRCAVLALLNLKWQNLEHLFCSEFCFFSATQYEKVD